MEKLLIIGGVAAGATAAAKARRLSPDTQITMLEAGPDVSFANCGLPYYIAGDIDSRSKLILQSPESFNEQYQVEVHVNTLVESIDNHLKNNNPKTAVVVGGGFIGLEMVEALVKRGLKVHVVEKMQHVMPLMEAETAGFLTRELLAFGVGIHTETAGRDCNGLCGQTYSGRSCRC
ncbi:MAG: FAD/NAD(P)-binding oxidoreductase [Draconibacterium sp.]